MKALSAFLSLASNFASPSLKTFLNGILIMNIKLRYYIRRCRSWESRLVLLPPLRFEPFMPNSLWLRSAENWLLDSSWWSWTAISASADVLLSPCPCIQSEGLFSTAGRFTFKFIWLVTLTLNPFIGASLSCEPALQVTDPQVFPHFFPNFGSNMMCWSLLCLLLLFFFSAIASGLFDLNVFSNGVK